MTNGQIMAAFNQCLFNSESGQAYCQWVTYHTKGATEVRETTLERAQRSGGVVFDLREVFLSALGESDYIQQDGVLEIDRRICNTIGVGESGAGTLLGISATLAMIRRGELDDNDLLDLPYMVLSQRPRREGRVIIPQYDGFPCGFSVRQTRNGGGCNSTPTPPTEEYCVKINVSEQGETHCVKINVSEQEETHCVKINVSE